MQPGEITIPVGNMNFSALEWGASEDLPLLAFHGWMDNAASFMPLANHLKGIRLIAVDLAGHGCSDHRAEGVDYGIWSYVEDVVNIIEALGFSQVSLLGHSLGAVISVMVAASVPRRVEKVVLIDGVNPVPCDASSLPGVLASYLQARKKIRQGRRINHYSSLESAIKARAGGRFPVSMDSARLLVERAMTETERGWQWRTDPRISMPSPFRMTIEQSLAFPKALTQECHLFFSEQGIIKPLLEQHANELAHIHLHPFQGGHHFHMEEQAEKVANTLVNLL
ncbi:alpha/beta hydrolase [Endozoicomonas sp. Mp262]|uniref:alpha/beta hydrolase n=1 Tax=Endozoicomonas sp. Mp262 TaxID=2919499 RepID=UPI0021DAA8ED